VIGHGRGTYAFVTFETEESAAAAIKEMNGKNLTTNGITVELSTSKPRKKGRVKNKDRGKNLLIFDGLFAGSAGPAT
jgi:RNA recognition motif-containing protein